MKRQSSALDDVIATGNREGCAVTLVADTAVDLARIQFATTSLYHFLFVPLTLGLAPLVAIMQTLWYRGGDDLLTACTLERNARDDCSVRTTDFVRRGESWSKRSEDAVLCNVIASTHNKSLERTRAR